MAVVSVTTFTAKPDRFEDAVADVRKVKAIFEKLGARNVRLLAALVAGEATGGLASTFEADDFASQGALQDKVLCRPRGTGVGLKCQHHRQSVGGRLPGNALGRRSALSQILRPSGRAGTELSGSDPAALVDLAGRCVG
jgi:hypothetical protein